MAKGRLIDACKTFDRKLRVTFEIGGEIPLDKEHELEISVKRWREKRSLDANAYLWVLIGKIADALRESKEEIYFDSLKCYGQGGAVSVEERFAEDFKRSYKYHEELGRSDLNGKTFVHFRFWVGSSEYNTEEMSILIDGVVREAKNLGIETMTPEELNSLIGGQ